MKVKNVLKGLMSEYLLEEINIITTEKVLFSGTIKQWNDVSEPYLLEYKREIEAADVEKRMIFNDKKVFIFIKD